MKYEEQCKNHWKPHGHSVVILVFQSGCRFLVSVGVVACSISLNANQVVSYSQAESQWGQNIKEMLSQIRSVIKLTHLVLQDKHIHLGTHICYIIYTYTISQDFIIFESVLIV